MPAPLTDTDSDALEVMSGLYARMTPQEKLARVRDLALTASRFALAGLRARHPEESESELLLRLALQRLGADVVARVYPPSHDRDGA